MPFTSNTKDNFSDLVDGNEDDKNDDIECDDGQVVDDSGRIIDLGLDGDE